MLTKATLAQECEGILQRSGTPAGLREVIVQELEHLRLLLVPCRLPPETKNELCLAEEVPSLGILELLLGWAIEDADGLERKLR